MTISKKTVPLSMEGKAPTLKINNAETNTRVKGNAIFLLMLCVSCGRINSQYIWQRTDGRFGPKGFGFIPWQLGASLAGHLEFSQLESPEKDDKNNPNICFVVVVVVVVLLDVVRGGLPVYVKIIANYYFDLTVRLPFYAGYPGQQRCHYYTTCRS